MKQILSFKEFGSLEFENNILTVRIQEGLELNDQILKIIFEEGLRLSENRRFCVLADVRKNVSSTGAARKYGANNPFNEKHIAYALLADTLPVILLSNFFINVNRPKVPTRLFKKEEEAIEWLLQQL